MSYKEKAPSDGSRRGLVRYTHPNISNPIQFPQERILWQAHRECFQRLQNDPSPTNRIIASVIAREWKSAYGKEVLHA
jgi:hypothetical protein